MLKVVNLRFLVSLWLVARWQLVKALKSRKIGIWACRNWKSAIIDSEKLSMKDGTFSSVATTPSWKTLDLTGSTHATRAVKDAWKRWRLTHRPNLISSKITSRITTFPFFGPPADFVTLTAVKVDGTCYRRESKAGCGQPTKCSSLTQIKFRQVRIICQHFMQQNET